ncbi:MAG: DUF3793 family protein [Mobilitalea sp.]
MKDYLKCICEDMTRAYVIFLLVNHCMPVLLQLKPSNLIHVNKKYIAERADFLITVAKEIELFDCKYTVIYENTTRYLLFIYNEVYLEKVLRQEQKKVFLEAYHYTLDGETIENVVKEVKDRYSRYRNKKMEFPHELGILLGYPLCDVEGFINNKGRNYILCGFWKVYEDADQALITFENYRRIRENAIREITSGKTLKDIKIKYLP